MFLLDILGYCCYIVVQSFLSLLFSLRCWKVVFALRVVSHCFNAIVIISLMTTFSFMFTCTSHIFLSLEVFGECVNDFNSWDDRKSNAQYSLLYTYLLRFPYMNHIFCSVVFGVIQLIAMNQMSMNNFLQFSFVKCVPRKLIDKISVISNQLALALPLTCTANNIDIWIWKINFVVVEGLITNILIPFISRISTQQTSTTACGGNGNGNGNDQTLPKGLFRLT